MFDLEQSIAAWRKQMLAAGIKSPVPLEELEIHLREEMERQVGLGLSGQKNFEISAQQIGQPKALTSEFKKSEGTFMKRTAKIGAVVAGILAGAAMMAPGMIQLQRELVMAMGKFSLWLLGLALIGGSSILFHQTFLPRLFKVESEKVELTPMKHAVKISAGMVVLLIGLTFTLPPIAQGLHEGTVKFDGICYIVFGNALLITGALVSFCPYKKRVA